MNESGMTCPNDRLRQQRIQRNWRQQDVADRVGTTVVTVTRWERGNQQPSAYFRVKLCALFGKSAEELGLSGGTLSPPTSIVRDTPEEIPTSSSQRLSLWTVPYRRNLYFTGRDDILHLLDQHLSTERKGEQTVTRRAALTQPQAIKGLGGIGKTQIAVEYAYRAHDRNQYTHILWINTASKEAAMTSFTALADLLPEFPATNETDQQKLVAAIKRWLEQCLERWLLIFDNADDLSWVQEYFPQQGNGSILLTTRANAVSSLATSVEVEKMGLIEGTHLLLRRAQRFVQPSDEEINEAGNIVVTLDYFPLALEQAGAYIEETECSLSNYLQLYQTHRSVLLARRGVQSTNYPDSVATTWSLSFHKVQQANPAAAELLRLCAFFSPDHIPEELLTNGAPYWPLVLQQTVTDLFTFNQMLEILLMFSLVKRLAENRLLSIHRLIQAVQMDMMDAREQRQWVERVVLAVNALFPLDARNGASTGSQCLRYLEQAQECDTLIQQWRLTLPEGADLLSRTGIYLYEHASYAIAEPLFQRALHIYEQSVEPEHLLMVTPLYNLAILYRDQGKYVEAESFFQQVLHIYEQSAEPEHVDVAIPLNGLAALYREQGRYTEAEPLYQHALSIYTLNLGPEHIHIATPLHNLAILYYEQGKFIEAEPLFLRALHIREQSLGMEHPHVASSLNGLATLYHTQGIYTDAEPLYQRALHIWEQSLGLEHPLVAYPLHNLAELYREQRKYDEAFLLFQRALYIREHSLGMEHPLVASSLNGLATLYHIQRMYTNAEPLYQRALHIYEQSVGSEHPHLAESLGGLAKLCRDQKRYAEAELLFQRALTIQKHALEPYHPDIAETLYGFAILQEMQGKSEEAASFYDHALMIRKEIYGPQHPKTTATYERLYTLLQIIGKTEEVSSSSDDSPR